MPLSLIRTALSYPIWNPIEIEVNPRGKISGPDLSHGKKIESDKEFLPIKDGRKEDRRMTSLALTLLTAAVTIGEQITKERIEL